VARRRAGGERVAGREGGGRVDRFCDAHTCTRISLSGTAHRISNVMEISFGGIG
jgi:hypothetical protein